MIKQLNTGGFLAYKQPIAFLPLNNRFIVCTKLQINEFEKKS